MTGLTPGPEQRPLRVLQLAARYLPDLGGVETHVHEVSRRLVHVPGIEVSVAASDRTGARPRREVVEGFDVLRRRAWPAERDYYFAPGLARLVRKGGWDVVHVQGIHTLVPVLGMLAAKKAGIPYVVTFHTGGNSSEVRNAARSAQWRILSPLLRGAAALVAVSRSERRTFTAATGLPESSIRVIRNGGSLPAPAGEVRVVEGRIVSSGRLERYKGHHRVIEALPLVLEKVPGASLDIVGAGPYHDELVALAERLGVADRVTIRHIPPGDRAGMASTLASSAVFAALSDYEAHPVAVMEALTLGVPVVGTDTAGVADLVEDGVVRGVPKDASPQSTAAVLLDAMRAGRPAPGAFDLPTWEGAVEQLVDTYRSVAAAGGPRAHRGASSPIGTGGPRVVHVIPGMAPGGAEKQIEALVEKGASRASVMCLYLVGQVGEGLRARGARVELLGMEGLGKLTALPRLALALRRQRPDVVHTHLLSGQLFGILAARLARVPVIVSTEHSIMEDTIEGRPKTPALRAAYLLLERLATHTIAVSQTTRDRLARWGVRPRRMTVIDNGVDFEALAQDTQTRAEVREELGFAVEDRVIGAVGRLDVVKRFEPLLRALAPLLREGAHLVIVGHGPREDALRRLALELGVGDQVHLTGPRPDVPRLLNAFDVFVSPSRDETFGIAVVEALGNGLPVVYAQCPALDDDDLRPSWALSIGVEAAEGLEAALLLEGVEKGLTAGRQDVPPGLLRRYGAAGVVAITEDVYASLLRR